MDKHLETCIEFLETTMKMREENHEAKFEMKYYEYNDCKIAVLYNAIKLVEEDLTALHVGFLDNTAKIKNQLQQSIVQYLYHDVKSIFINHTKNINSNQNMNVKSGYNINNNNGNNMGTKPLHVSEQIQYRIEWRDQTGHN